MNKKSASLTTQLIAQKITSLYPANTGNELVNYFSLKNSLIHVFLFSCLLMLGNFGLGGLVDPYGWDEIFHLHSGWARASSLSTQFVTPNLFETFTEWYWIFNGKNISNLFYFRIIISIFTVIQGIIIFNILKDAFGHSTYVHLYIHALISICLLAMLSGYRGYEVRPEFIANTGLLFVGSQLLKEQNSKKSTSLQIFQFYIGISVLIVSSAVSMRYIFPSLIFGIGLCYKIHKLRLRILDEAFFYLFVLLASLLIHIYCYPIGRLISDANQFQTARLPFPYMHRLTIGGGAIHLYFIVLFFYSWTFYIIRTYKISTIYKNFSSQFIIRLIFFISYIAFLIFLFGFDVRPYEYVRSLEACLLFLGLISILKYKDVNSAMFPASKLYVVILIMSFSLIAYSGFLDASAKGTLTSKIRNVIDSPVPKDLVDLDTRELVKKMVSRDSILTQTRTRVEFCKRFSNGFAFTFDWRNHPVCLITPDRKVQMKEWNQIESSFDANIYQFLSVPADKAFNFSASDMEMINTEFDDVWYRETRLHGG